MGKGDRLAGKLLTANHPVESVFEAARQCMHVFRHGEQQPVGARNLFAQVDDDFRQVVGNIQIRHEMRQIADAVIAVENEPVGRQSFCCAQQGQIGRCSTKTAAKCKDP